jgi:hypothetical protein
MQEHGFIFGDAAESGMNDVPGARQAGLPLTDNPTALLARRVEPSIHQAEVFAAVVNFNVVYARELTGRGGYQVLGYAVSDSCHVLGQVNSGIRIVTDPEQQNLPIHLIDSPDRAIQAVGNIRRMSRCNVSCFGADRCEGVGAVAPENAWQPPERIGNDTHAATGRCFNIEWMIVVVAHARHDQCAAGTDSCPQRLDEPSGAPIYRCQPRERGMHYQDTSRLNTEGQQLPGYLVRL